MKKDIAAVELMMDARKTRYHSTSSAVRVVKACKALGLDQGETIGVLAYLEYCDLDGKPHGPRVKRVW